MSLQSHLNENHHVHADTVVDVDHQTLLPDNEHVRKSPETFLDLPPESFWIPKDSEQDWYVENATIQRKTSMKLGFFGKSNDHHSKSFSHRTLNHHHHHHNHNQNPKSSSLFALPKSHKTSSTEGNIRSNKAPRRLFRSRSEPGRKGSTNVSEPGSPKVSCTGRVRCKKDRGVRTGFWRKLRAIFKIRSRAKSVANVEPAGSVGRSKS
ncbi:hypothetical protein BC332_29945 [Capsicum chinense]|nr:putative iron-sulfur assembly protein IscA-like 1, mitochondrial-like [Capsicum annuum]KAF3653709.1 putative iron-sulfur assembly protein IscA-like 1, mitochondrial-like [Capsicum annuum]PHU00158.1 hypothetical protein BC332_29945 [Capsicum chinense]